MAKRRVPKQRTPDEVVAMMAAMERDRDKLEIWLKDAEAVLEAIDKEDERYDRGWLIFMEKLNKYEELCKVLGPKGHPKPQSLVTGGPIMQRLDEPEAAR